MKNSKNYSEISKIIFLSVSPILFSYPLSNIIRKPRYSALFSYPGDGEGAEAPEDPAVELLFSSLRPMRRPQNERNERIKKFCDFFYWFFFVFH